MGNTVHHRAGLKAEERAALRCAFTTPTNPALSVVAAADFAATANARRTLGATQTSQPGIKAPVAFGTTAHEPYRGSRAWAASAPVAPPLLQQGARAWESKAATWGGRAIPKWTRYGYWDEEGLVFIPTRVL